MWQLLSANDTLAVWIGDFAAIFAALSALAISVQSVRSAARERKTVFNNALEQALVIIRAASFGAVHLAEAEEIRSHLNYALEDAIDRIKFAMGLSVPEYRLLSRAGMMLTGIRTIQRMVATAPAELFSETEWPKTRDSIESLLKLCQGVDEEGRRPDPDETSARARADET